MRLLAILAVLFMVTFAHAEPVPSLEGQTPHGAIKQRGKNFIVRGGNWWTGDGWIRPDGQVEIIWQQIETGYHCLGLYQYKDGICSGSCGWADRVTSKTGKLERIYPDDVYNEHPSIVTDQFRISK